MSAPGEPSDAMDTNFEDSDIELDFGPSGPSAEFEGDIEIYDVDSAAKPQAQTASTDADDVMAEVDAHQDQDQDLIDYSDAEDDVSPVQATQPTPQSTGAIENVEEDLIDYSDDDEPSPLPQVETTKSSSLHGPSPPATEAHNQAAVDTHSQVLDTVSDRDVAPDFADSVSDHVNEWNYDAEQSWDQNQEVGHEEAYGAEHTQELHADADDYDASASPHDVSTHSEEQRTAPDDQSNLENQDGEVDGPQENDYTEQLHLHPITVIYEGVELWLLKQHNAENEDWLLEDEAVVGKDFKELFEACRTALGTDVTDAAEMTLCFHQFHQMELSEDNTACIFSSLAELHTLYINLHAQDGHDRPASFAITLAVRPRFSALLNDLRRASNSGIGYDGFLKEIPAGTSNFSHLPSLTPTESGHEDWENGELEQEQEPQPDYEGAVTEHEKPDGDEAEKAGVEHARKVEDETAENDNSEFTNHTAADGDSTTEVNEEATGAGPNAAETSVPTTATPAAEEEDASHHDDADQADAESNQLERPSTSSSTIQGDLASATVDVDGNTTNPDLGDNKDLQNADAEDHDGQYDEVQYANGQYDEEYGQDYSEGFNQNFSAENEQDGEDYHQDEASGYVPGAEDDTSGSVDPTQYEDAEDDANINDDFENEFVDVGDLFDLDNAAGDVTVTTASAHPVNNIDLDHDEIDYDDEDVEVPPGQDAPSAAATSAAASTNGSSNLRSPLGHKRSIDEVGDEVDDATDSTDAKRTRLLDS